MDGGEYLCGSCGDLYLECECDDPVRVTYDELIAASDVPDEPDPAPRPAVRPTEPFVFTPVPAMPPVTVADLLTLAALDEDGLPDGAFVELSRALRGGEDPDLGTSTTG